MGGEDTEFPEWPALEGWQRWTRTGRVCVCLVFQVRGRAQVCV